MADVRPELNIDEKEAVQLKTFTRRGKKVSLAWMNLLTSDPPEILGECWTCSEGNFFQPSKLITDFAPSDTARRSNQRLLFLACVKAHTTVCTQLLALVRSSRAWGPRHEDLKQERIRLFQSLAQTRVANCESCRAKIAAATARRSNGLSQPRSSLSGATTREEALVALLAREAELKLEVAQIPDPIVPNADGVFPELFSSHEVFEFAYIAQRTKTARMKFHCATLNSSGDVFGTCRGCCRRVVDLHEFLPVEAHVRELYVNALAMIKNSFTGALVTGDAAQRRFLLERTLNARRTASNYRSSTCTRCKVKSTARCELLKTRRANAKQQRLALQ